jgi:N-acetylglucosamine-6-sulfatase
MGFSLVNMVSSINVTAYEASMRVPMLAFCPELIKPGTVVKQVVANIDVAPTLLEAAGLKAPGYMDGKSFLSFLAGKTQPWRNGLLYEYYWERNYPQTPTMHAIRGDRYKYIRYTGIWIQMNCMIYKMIRWNRRTW